jgi:hypothetical protein
MPWREGWSLPAEDGRPQAGLDRYGHLFSDELARLAERLQDAYAEAVTDPARTEGAEPTLGESKGAGR